jgi:phosphohistidine phosphatase
MELYVVRHGIAVEGGEGIPDGSRALTEKGRRRFHKTARAFGKLGRKLDLILTSPLVRAVQTAEILACEAEHGEVDVLEELDPKFDVAAVRAALSKRAGKSDAVAIVGHEPQLSAVLSSLTGVPQSDIDLKKGAIVRVDVAALIDGQAADGRWWLKPRSGSRVRGLPLQKQIAKKSRTAAKAKQAQKRKRVAKNARTARRVASRPVSRLPSGAEETAAHT